MSLLLNKYIHESEIARVKLSEIFSHNFDSLDIQKALCVHFGYSSEDNIRIVNHDLNAQEMVEILKNYDFNIPDQTETIHLEYSIIPVDLPGRVDEQNIKNNGEIWVIHKTDKDPFPSNPHAHNYASSCKLHLGTGDLYDKKNNFLNRKISKKELTAIRSKVKNISLPKMTV